MHGIDALLHPARVLQLVAVLTPPLAVIAPRGLAVVLPLASLLAAIGAWRKSALHGPPREPVIVLIAALLWSGASALWALKPALVWPVWGQIAGLGVAGLVLLGVARNIEASARQPIGLALAAGIAIALGLLVLEAVSSVFFEKSLGALLYAPRRFETYVFNRGVVTLAVLVWPAAFAVQQRFGQRAALALVLATMLVVSWFSSMAAILGLAGGLAVWLAALWRPRTTAIAVAGLIVIGAASAPLLPEMPPVAAMAARRDIPQSVYHRLEIWRFVSGKVAERPLAGWGLNASRELPGGDDLVARGQTRLPLHPHNAFLQWWLELGGIGTALGTALLLLAIRGAMRLDAGAPEATRWAQASALALVTAGGLIAAVGYGIWQAWWMAALWLAAALMASAGKSQARS